MNTKTRQRLTWQQPHNLTRWSVAIASVLLAFAILASAAVHAYIAQTYETEQEFRTGTLVALTGGDVTTLTSENASDYLGVVAVQEEGSVEVANSGATYVLVSDLDGEINRGDTVAISRLTGIATLWRPGTPAIGTALETLSSESRDYQQRSAILSDGTTQQVNVARIEVQLDESAGGEGNGGGSSIIPSALQLAAERIAGQPLPTWRILLALAVGFIGLLIASILLFSSARGSFFSLGRNPLAGAVILKGLWKMVTTSIIVLTAGLVLAYIIVRVG